MMNNNNNNKELKNTAPAVMTDTGPHNSTRYKSKDGRYTANPNYDQGQEPAQNPNQRSNAHKHSDFNKNTSWFDARISEPCFDTLVKKTGLFSMFSNDLKKGQISVFTKSTGYEDRVLGIDYFLGNASDQNQFLIDEPDIDRIDLKTITKGLGGKRDFFDHPRVSVTILKSHEDIYKPEPEDLMSKHQNNVFAFQVLYSSKAKEYIQNPNDIEEAKLYYVKKAALSEYMNKNALMNKSNIRNVFVDQKNKGYNLEDMVREEALAKEFGFEKTFDRKNNIITFSLKDKDTGCELLLSEDQTNGERSVRFNFPTKIFITDMNLKLNTHKFYKKFK